MERRRASVLGAAIEARALLPGLKALERTDAERIGSNGESATDIRYVALCETQFVKPVGITLPGG